MNDNDPMTPSERSIHDFITAAIGEAKSKALCRQQNEERRNLLKAYLRGLSFILGGSKAITLGIFALASIQFCWDARSSISLGMPTVGLVVLAISLLAAIDIAERAIGRWEWRPEVGSPRHYHFAVGMRAKRMCQMAERAVAQGT